MALGKPTPKKTTNRYKGLAAQGRYGDTMLAHVTPKEVKMLKRHGGAGTTNPKTGLKEFFSAGPGGDGTAGPGPSDPGPGGSASGGAAGPGPGGDPSSGADAGGGAAGSGDAGMGGPNSPSDPAGSGPPGGVGTDSGGQLGGTADNPSTPGTGPSASVGLGNAMSGISDVTENDLGMVGQMATAVADTVGLGETDEASASAGVMGNVNESAVTSENPAVDQSTVSNVVDTAVGMMPGMVSPAVARGFARGFGNLATAGIEGVTGTEASRGVGTSENTSPAPDQGGISGPSDQSGGNPQITQDQKNLEETDQDLTDQRISPNEFLEKLQNDVDNNSTSYFNQPHFSVGLEQMQYDYDNGYF